MLIKSMMTNEIAINDFNDRVLRGLRRKEKSTFVKNLNDNSVLTEIEGEEKLLIKLENGEFNNFFEKIIRGIYFYHKARPATGIIQCVSKRIINENIDRAAIIDFIKEDLNPETLAKGDYNNEEIFNYYYLDMEEVFVIQMKFYADAEFIGWVLPENKKTPFLMSQND